MAMLVELCGAPVPLRNAWSCCHIWPWVCEAVLPTKTVNPSKSRLVLPIHAYGLNHPTEALKKVKVIRRFLAGNHLRVRFASRHTRAFPKRSHFLHSRGDHHPKLSRINRLPVRVLLCASRESIYETNSQRSTKSSNAEVTTYGAPTYATSSTSSICTSRSI